MQVLDFMWCDIWSRAAVPAVGPQGVRGQGCQGAVRAGGQGQHVAACRQHCQAPPAGVLAFLKNIPARCSRLSAICHALCTLIASSYIGHVLCLSDKASTLQELPGRLWDGKEVVPEARGHLIAAEPHCVQPEEDVITALLGA